ncbi:hypothetical protein IQ268_19730 [Oculatella sp. LEGE 06141]|uniref:hypothetical protein n=1 Tax=Oculatella sp. LEGE 06141 TaxID=1828648 RepID=UPI001880A30A|nr:hypothetical protein [Oculatella sp. LEGE 06141]MBE9180795.1 hypothetical protein [Oculatella sp. LEGE 06141]
MTSQRPNQAESYPDEALAGDPSVSKEASSEVVQRVEGQNQTIKTPPKEMESEVAATDRDLSDLTMGIEDEA